ncbi:MAG TPA: SLC13 family permease, partial [Polyangiaceae bacterium]|nr:SLC13 family permease [Polyangiaceae bacterium]
MTWQAWTVIALTLVMVVALVRHWAGPDLVMAAAMTAVMALGIVPPEKALAGFANEGVLTVAALFAVAAGVRETGALDFVARRVLGRPKGLAMAQIRLLLPVSAMSGFLNNTPVVALMIPLVSDWGRRIGVGASKLLMPLSYAAILGGTCTLIGTSTNLVVAGLASSRGVQLGLFDVTPLGLAALVSGALTVVLVGGRLLPDRGTATESLEEARQYTVALRVGAASEVVGQTIEDAGLRQLPGLFLVELQRGDEVLVAVSPTTTLFEGDVLVFTGLVESVVDLTRIRGLEPIAEGGVLESSQRRRLVEAVVGSGSALLGQSVRKARFRTRYQAAIIAVHRGGERIVAKIGDIELEPGDTLLLETHPGFAAEHEHDKNFALVRDVEGSTPPDHRKAPIGGLVLLGMVALFLSGLTSLLVAALMATAVLLAT